MTDPTVYALARFRSVSYGDLVETTFERIQEALGLPAVQAADFEAHLPSIPGIQLQALHLVSMGSSSDLLLPVISQDGRLPLDAVLESDAFLAAAAAIAGERISLPRSEQTS